MRTVRLTLFCSDRVKYMTGEQMGTCLQKVPGKIRNRFFTSAGRVLSFSISVKQEAAIMPLFDRKFQSLKFETKLNIRERERA